jgi:hypothetical protein
MRKRHQRRLLTKSRKTKSLKLPHNKRWFFA